MLLEKNANVDFKERDSRTPLSWAAERRHDAIVRLLLDRVVDVDPKDV
jgi:ankyrin repeat protein